MPHPKDENLSISDVPNCLNRCLNSLETESEPFKQVFKQTENGATCKGFELVLISENGLGIIHKNGHTEEVEILGKAAVKNRRDQNRRQMEKAVTERAKINREMWLKYWQRGLDLIERAEAEQQAEKQKQERA